MNATLFLEAYGDLVPDATAIDAQEEDLHSVFRARADLMGWSAPEPGLRQGLWDMNEAELTADPSSTRLGWAQVGVSAEAPDPVLALPALAQCLMEALSRFGALSLTGFQVAIKDLSAPSSTVSDFHANPRNWFNLVSASGPRTYMAFDQDLIGDRVEELLDYLPDSHPMAFGPVIEIPEAFRIQVPAETPFVKVREFHPMGWSVTLPEWQASTAGWAIAHALIVARALYDAPRQCVVRITRVP